MRVAIATDIGSVSAHFGRCGEYTIYTIENGEIKDREVLANPGHEPGKIPTFLNNHNVEVIIAGGMGRRAQMLFDEMGIKHILGAIGTVDSVIDQFCNGSLSGGESLCTGGAGHEHSGDCHH